MELKLNKPIVFFDIESTGVNVGNDKIVEISMLKVNPSGKEEIRTYRINPGIHIPESTSLIHGIYDNDVADKPTFKDLGGEIAAFIGNADLGGYNCLKFDVPMLVEEFLRVGVDFDVKGRSIVDVQNIFHKMEPRTLRAAHRFYCGEDFENAHSAEADIIATYNVLKSQLDVYEGAQYEDKKGKISKPIVANVKALSDFTCQVNSADLVGHIIFNDNGEEMFNFGKHKGTLVTTVLKNEPQYYDWMMKSDFSLYTKKILTAIKLRNSGLNNGRLAL